MQNERNENVNTTIDTEIRAKIAAMDTSLLPPVQEPERQYYFLKKAKELVQANVLKILKDAGLVGVRQDGTANYYYLTLRDSTRSLMELGYRLEEFM